MPALDLTGSFAAGQRATFDRRNQRQVERAIDYELDELEQSRQSRHRKRENAGYLMGYEVPEYMGMQPTNGDPLYMRLLDWWKNRRATRVEPQTQLQEIDMGTIPARMADGGMPEDEIARRNAANRARYEQTRTERGLSPKQIAERRAAAQPAPSRLSRAGRAIRAGGAGVAAPMAIVSSAQSGRTPTSEYRERLGTQDAEPGFWGDVGTRALGVMEDLGNTLTGGLAGKLGHYIGSGGHTGEDAPASPPPTALPAQPSGESVSATPDEELAEQAIQQGTQMAEEVAEASKPPGEIDFSQADFRADEIPNMVVGDWVEFRKRQVDAMMQGGASFQEAMRSVDQVQQQGAVNYMAQAQMHLGSGNARAAANALRMAFQYFPNGSDVQLGVYQDPETGQPALLGRGINEETGEPVGAPMYLNEEKLAALRANFSDPNNFLAWTKDWRDEAFAREQFELEKDTARSTMRYQDRLGRAALDRGRADVLAAQARGSGGGRSQSDLDRASAAFRDAVELLGFDDEAQANRLAAAMDEIYYGNPGIPQNTVIDFVKRAQAEGRLDEMLTELGL